MTYRVKSPRKLIEVALPLDTINAACGREKSIRHGHPSTLHLWWARRPLAAARAVIFAQLVNDPGFQQGAGFRYGKNKKEAAAERHRLFKIMAELVSWENSANEEVLERARVEIRRSWREVCELNRDHPQASELFNPERMPGLHDPFAGGGAIPLEAQRLGIETFASDLNPVAVVINKAMVEIPAAFVGHGPVGPEPEGGRKGRRLALPANWRGTAGLAEDVRRYGAWLKEEAARRIGGMYPQVEITADAAQHRPDLQPFVGRKVSPIAFIWARTVKSPNPAFSDVEVPLASSFVVASKPGKEVYVEPVVKGGRYSFVIKHGPIPASAAEGTKAKGRGANFRCLLSDTPISGDYIKQEGQAGRLGARLMAVVAEGDRARIYLPPTPELEAIASSPKPAWRPSGAVPARLSGGTCVPYGLAEWGDLFTPRQLVLLTTLGDLVAEARAKIVVDARRAGFGDDDRSLVAGGRGAVAYADAVAVYLSFVVEKLTESHSTICTWSSAPKNELVVSTFRRQALPMTWDYAEANPFADSSGSIEKTAEAVARVISMALNGSVGATVTQEDAANQQVTAGKFVSTDPPYYDNINYADLSDFFYVWMRRTLRPVFPGLFSTLAVPKAEELVATAHRHGGREAAERFFLEGMTRAMKGLASNAHPEGVLTIYYAFKQSDIEDEQGTSSTGWETFLEAVIRSGLQVTGTWPMRTERESRSVGIGTNSLASSIVLVCRRRSSEAPLVSRREFLRELNAALPDAVDEMMKGAGDERPPVDPVDLSQAVIGPGMAIFSRYAAVLEADGSPMRVGVALRLINRFLEDDDFDPDTQFCLKWFEQSGWHPGKFGDADQFARSKGTSVEGVKSAGVLSSGGGTVRLIRWSEYDPEWDPRTDTRNPIWETLHHLVRALKQSGEEGAGRLLAVVSGQGEQARQLAYRLYTLCERQAWTDDARIYNEIITSWSGIEAAASAASVEPVQGKLFD